MVHLINELWIYLLQERFDGFIVARHSLQDVGAVKLLAWREEEDIAIGIAGELSLTHESESSEGG